MIQPIAPCSCATLGLMPLQLLPYFAMAIFPFTLRALRIRKLFYARDRYWLTDKMPKEQIKNLSEIKIIKTFVKIGLLIIFIYIVLVIFILLVIKNPDLQLIFDDPSQVLDNS